MFDPTTLTGFHTWLSLLALFSGIVVVIAMLVGRRLEGWTAFYLATAVATSVTGYFFPTTHLLPSQIVGAISLLLLALAILARYGFHLAAAWRWIYATTAVAALFLDVFVAIAQAFAKIPALHALAPTQSEPPFAVAQLVNLAIFIALGIAAARLFRREPAAGQR